MVRFGVIYLGSLFALLANAFFRLDDFTGQVVREVGISNFIALFEIANLDAARRSIGMAVAVTLACTVLAFPLALVMARHASGATKAALYIAVMLPLWARAIHCTIDSPSPLPSGDLLGSVSAASCSRARALSAR